MKNQPFLDRLGYSVAGLRAAWQHEASFRFQGRMALGVVVLLVVLRPEAIWWALLLLNCGLVLAAELFNTALEHALDHLHPERHPAIKISKDCAAGAVLVFSLTSVATFLCFVGTLWLKTVRKG